MNLKKASFCFAGFLLLTLAAESARFLSSDQEWLIGLVFGAGVLLGEVLLHSGGPAGIMGRISGLLLAIAAFFSVGQVESLLRAVSAREPVPMSAFSSLPGHCGISAGRAIIGLYDTFVATPDEARLREYQIHSACRLRALSGLERSGGPACDPGDRPLVCRVRWMEAVSAEGNWDLDTRRFFFETALRLWNEARDDEGLVAYAMKDQEIQNVALNESVQAHGTSGAGVVELQKNSRIHNELSRKIFEAVSSAIAKEGLPPGGGGEAFRARFRERQEEFRKRSSR